VVSCGRECVGGCSPSGNDACEEFDHLNSVTTLTIKEVEAVLNFFDGYGIFLRRMFEDELFEEKEGPFVRDFLPDLDECLPGVLCC
jgi:hypothetical protein